MNPDYYKDMADAKREFKYRYERDFEYRYGKIEKTTKEILDGIDIQEIEKYLRKKKLEKIENLK